MTPEERYWRRVMQRAKAQQPGMDRAILAWMRSVREQLDPKVVADFVRNNDVDRMVSALLSDDTLDRLSKPISQQLFTQTQQNIDYFKRSIPKQGAMALGFDVQNPRHLEAVRALDTKVIQRLKDDVRGTVRNFTEDGIRNAIGPREIGRQLRSVVGLVPKQLQEVENFRKALEDRDVDKILSYKRRDSRFDSRIMRGDYGPAEIEKWTERYKERRIAWNSETIARTTTLDALKSGERMTWEAAVSQGLVDRDRLMKQWVGVMDSRERPEHRAMEKQVRHFDDAFSNGELTPGASTYNCFPAGTLIEGSIVAGLKVSYSGPLRKLKTARGHCLSLTPNHPVLTTRGWIAAGMLHKGDTLLCNRTQIDRGSAEGEEVQHQHVPARIEQIFHALGSQRAATMKGSLHLHGDAIFTDGQVDIVGADWELSASTGMVRGEKVGQDGLPSANPRLVQEHATGAPKPSFETVSLPAASGLCSAGLSSDSRWVGLDGLPFKPLRVGAAAGWDTLLGERSKQDSATISAFIRELLHASAGAIALDELVEIQDFDAIVGSHVFDVQSETGWIIAQGVVTSNCRCLAKYKEAPKPRASISAPKRRGPKPPIGPEGVLRPPSSPRQPASSILPKLEAAETLIAGLGIEHAVAFTADGREVLRESGNTKGVSFTDPEKAKLEHATLTHNHPDGQWGLSDTDIGFAMKYNLAEFRVVTLERLTRVLRSPQGWNAEYWTLRVKPVFERIHDALIREWQPLVSRGTMDAGEYHERLYDETWRRVAREVQLDYRSEARGEP